MYFFVAVLVLWAIAVQTYCFNMRTADSEWPAKMERQGQMLAPRFLDVPSFIGRNIHSVTLNGNDSLPFIVFVHGSPGAADAYLTYLADTAISRVAQMAAIDRPGFGYTSGFGIPEPSQAAQAAAVLAVVDHLALNQKVILVGHSLGGPVICRFAMDYPERTAGLVIVAGSIDPTQEKHPWWQTVVDVPPVKWLTPKPLWTSNAEIIPLEQELKEMLPLWPRITCPVRILHAVNDRLVPVANADFARRMLTNCPDLKVEILPDGDHFILWSRQDVVRKAIMEVLGR
jgi:pimeloyl-ACP methyl ester carboxylesterase